MYKIGFEMREKIETVGLVDQGQLLWSAAIGQGFNKYDGPTDGLTDRPKHALTDGPMGKATCGVGLPFELVLMNVSCFDLLSSDGRFIR